MEHLGLVKTLPREVAKVEEFNLEVKDKKVKATALLKLDSLLAVWLYRVAILAMLGWNGNLLNTLSDRIADRVALKISASKSVDVPEVAEPAEGSTTPPVAKPKSIKRVPPAKREMRHPSPGVADPPQGALIAPRQAPFPVMACNVPPKGDFK
jgi:hypothetical protein